MSCKSCELTKATGKRSHHPHSTDCPRSRRHSDHDGNNRTECGICHEMYRANGSYPNFCKSCFDKWS